MLLVQGRASSSRLLARSQTSRSTPSASATCATGSIRSLTAARRNGSTSSARSICDYAISEEWITENVAKSVDCRHVPYDDSYDYFSADEIERLIAAASDPYDAALYAAAAYTGLRKGELFGLQWRDIDFDHARILVRRNVTLNRLGTPKNGKIRVVPLDSTIGANG